MPAIFGMFNWLSVFRWLAATLVTLTMLSCGGEKDSDRGVGDGISPSHTVNFNGVGVDLATDGNLMVLAARNNGLVIFDTTRPERPIEIGSVDLPYVYRALIKGTSVLGFDEQSGLSIADLKNLNQLQLTQALSSAELFGYVNDALWIDQTLLFASESIGLSQYSVGPQFDLSGEKFSGTGIDFGADSVSLVGQRLVTAAFRGEINIYEWTAGALPADRLTLSNRAAASHRINDVDCGPTHCFAAGLNKGLFTYNAPLGVKPELVQQIEYSESIGLVHVDEELLFVSYTGSKEKNGFYVYSLSDPANLRLRHKVATEAEIRDFLRVGYFTYILLANDKLLIYDHESMK